MVPGLSGDREEDLRLERGSVRAVIPASSRRCGARNAVAQF